MRYARFSMEKIQGLYQGSKGFPYKSFWERSGFPCEPLKVEQCRMQRVICKAEMFRAIALRNGEMVEQLPDMLLTRMAGRKLREVLVCHLFSVG